MALADLVLKRIENLQRLAGRQHDTAGEKCFQSLDGRMAKKPSRHRQYLQNQSGRIARINDGQCISQPSEVIQIEGSLARTLCVFQKAGNPIPKRFGKMFSPLLNEPAGKPMRARLPHLLVIQLVAESKAEADTIHRFNLATTGEVHQRAGRCKLIFRLLEQIHKNLTCTIRVELRDSSYVPCRIARRPPVG